MEVKAEGVGSGNRIGLRLVLRFRSSWSSDIMRDSNLCWENAKGPEAATVSQTAGKLGRVDFSKNSRRFSLWVYSQCLLLSM